MDFGLGDIFKKAGSGIVEGLANGASALIKDFKADPNKVIDHDEKVRQLAADATKQLNELADAADARIMADIQNARAMQIAALGQTDSFAKRFIYYLACGVILLTLCYDFALFWVRYPAENRDMINMVGGTLNTGCLVTIITFFFGSSKSSHDKQETIDKMNEQ